MKLGTLGKLGTVIIPQNNIIPNVNAGTDISGAQESSTISITGTASGNDGATIISTLWEEVTSTGVNIVSPDSLTTDLVLPSGNNSVSLMLTVTDSNGETNNDSINIGVVSSANTAPTAIITGGEHRLNQQGGDTITLDASGSIDPQDNIVSWQWSEISSSSLTIVNPTSEIATFVAPTFTVTSASSETLRRWRRYQVQLVVTDAGGLTSTTTQWIQVVASVSGNVDFSLIPDSLPTVAAGKLISLNARAIVDDVNSDVSSVAWFNNYPNYYPATYNSLITAGYLSTTTTAKAPSEDQDLDIYIDCNLKVGGFDTCKTIVIPITQGVTRPIALASTDVDNADELDTVTIDLTSSVNMALGSYKLRQSEGPEVDLIDNGDGTYSFEVSSFSEAKIFTQDLAINQPTYTIGTFKPPIALDRVLELELLGIFRASGTSSNGSPNLSNGSFSISLDGTQMYLAGRSNFGYVGRLELPTTFGNDIETSPVAQAVEDYFLLMDEFTEGVQVNPTSRFRYNGFQEFEKDGGGTALATTHEDFYGQTTFADNMQLVEDLSLGFVASAKKGFFQLEGKRRVGGYMTRLPADLQTLFGVEYVVGWSPRYSIVSAQSVGPTLHGWRPQDLLDANWPSERDIATTPIVSYSFTNQIVDGGDDTTNINVGPIWAGLSFAGGVAAVENSGKIFYGGRHAGMDGGFGYKIITEVNGTPSAGGTTYLGSSDFYAYIWQYDAQEMKDNQVAGDISGNYHEILPESYYKVNLPFDAKQISGMAYNDVTQRLYMSCTNIGAPSDNFYSPPLFYAFSCVARPNIIPADIPSRITFDVEAIDANGYTDSTSISLNVNVDSVAVITVTPSNQIVGFDDALPTFTKSAVDSNGDAVDPSTITESITFEENPVSGVFRVYTHRFNVLDALEVTRTITVQAEVDTTLTATINAPATINTNETVSLSATVDGDLRKTLNLGVGKQFIIDRAIPYQSSETTKAGVTTDYRVESDGNGGAYVFVL